MSERSHFHHLSSRIKKIAVQLYGYTFYHSPSEIHNTDFRFLGREKIIRKLKAILMESETRSGAYLITGYRGMGKSSFVNHVIDEVMPQNWKSFQIARYVKIALFSVILCAFHFQYIIAVLASGLFGFLFWNWSERNSHYLTALKLRSRSNGFQEYIRHIFLTFVDICYFYFESVFLSTRRSPGSRTFNFFQDIYLSMFIACNIAFPATMLSLTFLAWFLPLFFRRKDTLHFHNSISHLLWVITIFLVQIFVAIADREFSTSITKLSKFLLDYCAESQILVLQFIADILSGVNEHLAHVPEELTTASTLGYSLFQLLFLLAMSRLLLTFQKRHSAKLKDTGETLGRNWPKSKTHFFQFFKDFGPFIANIPGSIFYLKEKIKKYFNGVRRIPIRVNLGYDDLQEIDILRLVAHGIQDQYKLLRSKLAILSVLKYFALYIFVSALFFSHGFHDLSKSILLESGLIRYFPSQVLNLVDTSSNIQYQKVDIEVLEWLCQPTDSESLRSFKEFNIEDQASYDSLNVIALELLQTKLSNDTTWDSLRLPSQLARAFAYLDERLRENPDGFLEDNLDSLILIPNYVQGISNLSSLFGTDLPQQAVADLNSVLTAPDSAAFWQKSLIHIDIFSVLIYNKIWEALVGKNNQVPLVSSAMKALNNLPIHIKLSTNRSLRLIPPRINWIFVATLLVALCAFNLIFRFRIAGIVSNRYVLKQLKALNDRIEAQISTSQQAAVGIPGLTAIKLPGFGAVFGKRKTLKIADEREIEKQLIRILEDISNIPTIFLRPEFIIVFDELDKIEPRSLMESDIDTLARIDNHADSASERFENRKGRQLTILNILANLKHFLNTAKAKFIFIAEREMYDAALADVSDRHYFIGSIFHDIIYVESFLKDQAEGITADITAMTEAYVCQFILPPSQFRTKAELNLQTYHAYLLDEVFPIHEDSPTQNKVNEWCRNKLIYTLKEFIVYVTYRSNGAPKKITQLFENHVTQITQKRFENADQDFITVGNQAEALYLVFDFYTQYKFGMIAYLVNPFIYYVIRGIRDYGDKLMVSAAFLIDHLYKYNGAGFSWDNLELMPEVIDVHKAPQLRELINQILNFLQNTHIEQIINGFYDFKFSKNIVEEIQFLSKVSESESAAFNFTLDESQALKRHYALVIKDLERRYRKKDSSQIPQVIHALCFMHRILGDLYYYDEDFNNAIIEYREATEPLLGAANIVDDIPRFIILIRNKLKIGLTFERKKSYDQAASIYNEVTRLVFEFCRLLSDDTYLEIWQESGESEIPYKPQLKAEGVMFQQLGESYRQHIIEGFRLIYQSLLADFVIIEKLGLGGITGQDIIRLRKRARYLRNLIKDPAKYLVYAELMNKIGDVLFFKNGPIGRRVSDESETALQTTFTPAHKIPHSDAAHQDLDDVDKPIIYCNRSEALCTKNRHISKLRRNRLKAPCRACGYYMQSLNEINEKYLTTKKLDEENTPIEWDVVGTVIDEIVVRYEKDDIAEAPEREVLKNLVLNDKNKRRRNNIILINLLSSLRHDFHHDKPSSRNHATALAIANSLSDIGDTFLSCAAPQEELSLNFLEDLLFKLFASGDDKEAGPIKERHKARDVILIDFLSNRGTKARSNNSEGAETTSNNAEEPDYWELGKLEEVLVYYYLASAYFVRAGDHKNYTLQLRKILQVIREYLWSSKRGVAKLIEEDIDSKTAFIEKIHNLILKRALRGLYRAHNNVHRLEIRDYEFIFKGTKKAISYPISLTAEINNQLLVYHGIRLKLLGLQNCQLTMKDRLLSSYTSVNNIFSRIRVLRYKVRLYEKMYNEVCGDYLENVYRTFYFFRKPGDPGGGSSIKVHTQKFLSRLSKYHPELKTPLSREVINISDSLNPMLNVYKMVAFEKGELSGPTLMHSLEGIADEIELGFLIARACAEIDSLPQDGESLDEKQVNEEQQNDNKQWLACKRGELKESMQLFNEANEKITELKQNKVLIEAERIQAEIQEHQTQLETQIEKIKKVLKEIDKRNDSQVKVDTESYKEKMERFLIEMSGTGGKKAEQISIGLDEESKDDRNFVSKFYYQVFQQQLQDIEQNRVDWGQVQELYPSGFMNICYPDDVTNLDDVKNRKDVKKVWASRETFIENLIIDAITTIYFALNASRIYSASYMTTHNVLGSLYRNMATWSRRLQGLKNIATPKQKKLLEQRLEQQIGREEARIYTNRYCTEMALKHYWSSIEVHDEGQAYREFLENMYYLNDDFNDNLYHFTAALERYWINSGKVRSRIKELKAEMKYSRWYEADQYMT